MKKTDLLLMLFAIYACLAYSQNDYEYDDKEDLIFYEGIIEIPNESKTDLIQKFKKYLQVNQMPVYFEDQNEIYAIGESELLYKSHFLIFFNNQTKDVIYDLKFSFKDGKVKYRAYNFNLVPKKINIYSIGSSSSVGTGFIGSSITRIPREIPKEPIENLYRVGKNHKRYKIFQDLNKQMDNLVSELKKSIEKEDTDW